MKKGKKSKWGLIFLVLVIAYFAYTMFDIQKSIYAKQQGIDKIQVKIDQEKSINQELNKLEKMLNTDEYIKKIAREQLGMVKPGERKFIDPNK